MATKRQRRRRRPAHWMDAGFSPLWSEAHISFHRRVVRTGRRLVMPMARIEGINGVMRAYPDGTNGELIYGLALRVHRQEREARRSAQRIARLERELAAAREHRAGWGKNLEAFLGLPCPPVLVADGDGWAFAFERDQGFLALAPILVPDLVEDRRRA